MIHIKETEIIPFLKTAQTGYTKMISEGDLEMEAMGESKKEKTDNQICKWLKDPESDSAKYKMWGNGIALPCAMFVMEGIAMILSEEDADEQK